MGSDVCKLGVSTNAKTMLYIFFRVMVDVKIKNI